MKMTRLEAIKAWGRASREGKPIPEEVREVLSSTQNDGRHDFHVEPPTAKVKVGKEQAKRKMDGNKSLTVPAAIHSVGVAFNPEQMEIYNQKRKLDNQKRKGNPQLYANMMHELLESGLSRKQATKKAKAFIQRKTLERLDNEEIKPAAEVKFLAKYQGVFNEEKIKSAPLYRKQVKQGGISEINKEQEKIEAVLTIHPISCIDCKIDFKSFGVFIDHARDIHHIRINKPKLISEVKTPVFANILKKPSILSSNESVAEVITIPVARNLESFSDKWIRLFEKNGYTVAMVDAFKREATKQDMDVIQVNEFLSTCKPSKYLLGTPIRHRELMIPTVQLSSITNPLETLEDTVVNNPFYVPTQFESIKQALFADRIVRTRINQNDFKERVAANFDYRCAITNSREALEAAHIEPVGTGNNNTSNGLLMLVCLHRLFDAGLMAIDPNLLTVHFKPDCTYFAKIILEGKKINEHSVALNKTGLQERWLNFNE